MGVAYRVGAIRRRLSPREPALRKARICYDHLAGEMGVRLFDSMQQHRYLRFDGDAPELTASGRRFCRELGVDVDALTRERRALCRVCLDWSVRRNHLAGALGAALLRHCIESGWARRARGSRVVSFSEAGEAAFSHRFELRQADMLLQA
jgi:hypothetical protein